MASVSDTPLVFPAYWIRPGFVALSIAPGIMRLEGERISFKTSRGVIFDASTDEFRKVSFPAWNRGTAVKFKLGGKRYRIAFTWRYDGIVPRALTDEAGIPAEDWSGPPIELARQRGAEVQRRLTPVPGT